MKVIPLVALAALTATGPVPAQEPPGAAPPVFGVGVDVVAVDASVVDPDGRPVLGLSPADFRVEVDGKPRRVVSVEYVGRELEAPAPPAAPRAHFSSNEGVEPGRLVLFLVDRGNIARASGRNVFASAARFIGTLPPADRVGLAVVPGPGPMIEFTPERDEVRKALRGVLGQGQSDHGAFRVPLDEAVKYLVHHDRFSWQEYTDLECAFQIDPQRVEECRLELEGQAAQVLANYRERSLQSKRALLSVLRGLKAVEGSKTVVLISEGLWTETLAEVDPDRRGGGARPRSRSTSSSSRSPGPRPSSGGATPRRRRSRPRRPRLSTTSPGCRAGRSSRWSAPPTRRSRASPVR